MQKTAQRIKSVREQLGLSQGELAERMNYSRTFISLLERGKNDPGPRFLKELEILERAALLHDVGHSSAQSPSSAKLRTEEIAARYDKQIRMIPLISWAQAGIATAFDEIPEHWQERVPAAVSDASAFAIQLRGDSMEPEYRDGDVAVVLPRTAARNGDVVVANIKEEGFACKIMTLVGGDVRRIRLSSYNPAYPPMEFNREDFHWIYPVYSTTRIRRK